MSLVALACFFIRRTPADSILMHVVRPEAVIAVRHRLEQTSTDLDTLRKEHHALQARCTKLDRLLKAAQVDRASHASPPPACATAQADLELLSVSLVDADQLEALRTIRESVSAEKAALEAQVDDLQASLHAAEDKARLQMEEVNKLLSGKVREQDGEISLRDDALKREEELRCVIADEAQCPFRARFSPEVDSVKLSWLHRSARQSHEARAVEHAARVEALERERDDLAAKVQKMKEVRPGIGQLRKSSSRRIQREVDSSILVALRTVHQAAGQAVPCRASRFDR